MKNLFPAGLFVVQRVFFGHADEQNSASNPSIVSNINNLFSASHIGLTCFLTGANTTDTPQNTEEWKYSIGFLLKRDSEIGTIILCGKGTGNMAICPVTKVLGTWRILQLL